VGELTDQILSQLCSLLALIEELSLQPLDSRVLDVQSEHAILLSMIDDIL